MRLARYISSVVIFVVCFVSAIEGSEPPSKDGTISSGYHIVCKDNHCVYEQTLGGGTASIHQTVGLGHAIAPLYVTRNTGTPATRCDASDPQRVQWSDGTEWRHLHRCEHRQLCEVYGAQVACTSGTTIMLPLYMDKIHAERNYTAPTRCSKDDTWVQYFNEHDKAWHDFWLCARTQQCGTIRNQVGCHDAHMIVIPSPIMADHWDVEQVPGEHDESSDGRISTRCDPRDPEHKLVEYLTADAWVKFHRCQASCQQVDVFAACHEFDDNSHTRLSVPRPPARTSHDNGPDRKIALQNLVDDPISDDTVSNLHHVIVSRMTGSLPSLASIIPPANGLDESAAYESDEEEDVSDDASNTLNIFGLLHSYTTSVANSNTPESEEEFLPWSKSGEVRPDETQNLIGDEKLKELGRLLMWAIFGNETAGTLCGILGDGQSTSSIAFQTARMTPTTNSNERDHEHASNSQVTAPSPDMSAEERLGSIGDMEDDSDHEGYNHVGEQA